MRGVLVLLMIAVGAAAAWLLFSGDAGVAPDAAAGLAARAARPEAGRLEGDLASAPAGTAIERSAAQPATAAAGATAQAPAERAPAGWFRGRLRVVSGELTLPPLLTARQVVSGSPELSLAWDDVRVDPRTLEFEVAATDAASVCRMKLPPLLKAVGALGGELEESGRVRFAGMDTPLVIDVEVKPHAAVLFLHAVTGEPLAGAQVHHRVEAEGSSTSYGAELGPDGLLLFDFERLGDVEGAETITFSARRPPDIGASDAPAFPVDEFLRLPRPVVLRFAPTELLHFRVIDPGRRPIAGASVIIGHGGDDARTDAEGRIAVLQSSPTSATVRAEAAGFLSSELPIEASAASQQDLMLWPASRLVIEGVAAPPAGWQGLEAEISFDGKADSSILTPESFRAGRFVENDGGTMISQNTTDLKFEMSTGFSPAGRVVVDGIHADVPARVLVRFRGFVVLDERVPFAPGDGEHRLSLPAMPECVALRGRVLDERGAPVAGASLRLLTSGMVRELSAASGADGAFELGGVPVGGSVEVLVRAAGFAPRKFSHVAASGDDKSMGDLTLVAGRSLRLQVLGPDGLPLPTANDWSPTLRVFGENVTPQTAPGVPLAAGEFLFIDLPEGNWACSIQRGYQRWGGEHLVNPASGNATITLTAEEVEWLTRPQ